MKMLDRGRQRVRKRSRLRSAWIAVARMPVIAWAVVWYPLAAIAGHAQRVRADELQRTLDRVREDARWENERLTGQIAILNEQLKQYVDIANRERARVAAETAILARRERNAQYSGGGQGQIDIEV